MRSKHTVCDVHNSIYVDYFLVYNVHAKNRYVKKSHNRNVTYKTMAFPLLQIRLVVVNLLVQLNLEQWNKFKCIYLSLFVMPIFLYSFHSFTSTQKCNKIFTCYKRRYLISKRNYFTPSAIFQFQSQSKNKILNPLFDMLNQTIRRVFICQFKLYRKLTWISAVWPTVCSINVVLFSITQATTSVSHTFTNSSSLSRTARLPFNFMTMFKHINH